VRRRDGGAVRRVVVDRVLDLHERDELAARDGACREGF
jgi:hypothetical protein